MKKSRRTSEFLEKMYPTEQVKECVGISKKMDDDDEWRELMGNSKIVKWYQALCRDTDGGELSESMRMLWFSLWKRALKEDTQAAKMFMERFDTNYKPAMRHETQIKADVSHNIKDMDDEELRRLAGAMGEQTGGDNGSMD